MIFVSSPDRMISDKNKNGGKRRKDFFLEKDDRRQTTNYCRDQRANLHMNDVRFVRINYTLLVY